MKLCTMNCGATRSDTRTDDERMNSCEDCVEVSSGVQFDEIESLKAQVFKLRDALEQLIEYHLMIGNSGNTSMIIRAREALK